MAYDIIVAGAGPAGAAGAGMVDRRHEVDGVVDPHPDHDQPFRQRVKLEERHRWAALQQSGLARSAVGFDAKMLVSQRCSGAPA